METSKMAFSTHDPGVSPTRWGNQLNGNFSERYETDVVNFESPTRWGNQLNGNNNGIHRLTYCHEAPLAGAIS